MDYSSVKLLNPALVYCSITGFGPGKEENQPGYDFLVHTLSARECCKTLIIRPPDL
jgi:crotonobetainyl-CoA:carnitine CoA-transferase CaiB-like acyl-CoA transferase